MKYISVIYRYHWSCIDRPNYNLLIPRRKGPFQGSKYSAFEIQPDDVIGLYFSMNEKNNLPQIEGVTQLVEYDANPEEKISHKGSLCAQIFENNILRTKIRESLINRINQKIESFKESWFFYDLVDLYLKAWDEVILVNETLENLWIFNQMFETTIDEGSYVEELKLRFERENSREMPEERYTWEDSYRDAGGGDEWSDPSEFW